MCMALQCPGAEKDQQERSRAHLTLKQVTRSPGNCDELNFQDAATLSTECAHPCNLQTDVPTLIVMDHGCNGRVSG